MADGKNYVTKDNFKEKKNYEEKQVHVQFENADENLAVYGHEWTDLTEVAGKSQYRSAYDEHISMRDKLMRTSQSERLKDYRSG